MIILRFSWVLIVFLLSFSAISISCAEDSSSTTTHPGSAVTTSVLAHASNVPQLNYRDFSEFYNDFSRAVDRSDWEHLAKLTRFPFILEGELDGDGRVVFDKGSFIKSIDELLKEEIYINLDDDLVVTTYRKIILKSKNNEQVDGDEAQLFGIQFHNTGDGWRVLKITTHVHIVEKYSKEK